MYLCFKNIIQILYLIYTLYLKNKKRKIERNKEQNQHTKTNDMLVIYLRKVLSFNVRHEDNTTLLAQLNIHIQSQILTYLYKHKNTI